MHDRTPTFTLARLGARALAITGAIAVLIVGALVLDGPRTVWGDHPDLNCEVTDLGTLGTGMDRLQTEGRWTTEDCDSRFLPNSDAHTYRFDLAEDGHVRIDLTSPDGDSYIHLLAEDGSRIAHDDDGGYGLDSRVEYNLTSGSYLVEASLGSGRARGPADFTLTVRRVTNCDPVDLGTLESGGSLEMQGVWAADDCRARYRDDTPAQTFRFELLEEGLVRIDLIADEGGDPFVYLLSSDGTYILSDDDDGTDFNSRIETDLAAGTYLIEATTYGGRDHVHLLTGFTLTLSFVTPDAFQIKTEAIHVPDQVVAGDPFTVHYRVGNLGHTELPEANSAVVYLVSGRAFDRTAHVPAAGGRWRAGASYHSGPETASATSTTLDVLRPLTITISAPGPSWVVLAIVTNDESGQEIGLHRIERDLLVLSGPTFGPVPVRVDGTTYEVTATADEEGLVTTSVTAVADSEAEVDSVLQAKAIYAAGVGTQLLADIFARPTIVALPEMAEPTAVRVANPSSSVLIDLFADHYTNAIAAAGLAEALAAGEAISAAAVEALALSAAEAAAARYATLAASWRSLQERIAGEAALTFAEAVTVQAELAYAEGVVAPAVQAGAIVEAARVAEEGWQDPRVRVLIADLTASVSCEDGPSLLRGALEAAGVADVDAVLTLDAELRAALPVYGLATDSAICAAAGSDATTGRFLGRLALADTAVHQDLVSDSPSAPDPAPAPALHQLRIVAQLLEDGQIELGVELASGERILPVARLLPTDAIVDRWYVSSAIEADGGAIGKIRVRRLIDGRAELGFRDAGGTALVPILRYLAADLPAGVWHRSSAIEVPPAEAASE